MFAEALTIDRAQLMHDLYAYDAYLVTCALAQRAPLLTLDRALGRAAAAAGVQLVERPE